MALAVVEHCSMLACDHIWEVKLLFQTPLLLLTSKCIGQSAPK